MFVVCLFGCLLLVWCLFVACICAGLLWCCLDWCCCVLFSCGCIVWYCCFYVLSAVFTLVGCCGFCVCVIGGLGLFGGGCLNLIFVLGLVLVWLIIGLFAWLLVVVCSLISWCLLLVCLFDGFGLRLVNSVDLFYFGYFAFVLVLFCDYCFVYWLLVN